MRFCKAAQRLRAERPKIAYSQALSRTPLYIFSDTCRRISGPFQQVIKLAIFVL